MRQTAGMRGQSYCHVLAAAAQGRHCHDYGDLPS